MLLQLLKIKNDTESDWWNNLSELDKNKVVSGLKDSVEGRVTDNERILKKYEI